MIFRMLLQRESEEVGRGGGGERVARTGTPG